MKRGEAFLRHLSIILRRAFMSTQKDLCDSWETKRDLGPPRARWPIHLHLFLQENSVTGAEPSAEWQRRISALGLTCPLKPHVTGATAPMNLQLFCDSGVITVSGKHLKKSLVGS